MIHAHDSMRARARGSDPCTSHLAAHLVDACGAAPQQRQACLEAVRRHPGRTAAEIAAEIGLERHAPSRRLPELRQAGLVRNGPPRICHILGRSSLTWWPVDASAAACSPTMPDAAP